MDFGSDPLLGYRQTPSVLQESNDELSRKIAELQNRRASINMQAQVSQTPLWDEIDKIQDGLTTAQNEYMMGNSEYVESLQYITKLVQDEQLRIIRPRIESTQTGREALKRHLSLMQKMKKEASQEEEQRAALLNDYMTNHSDMTWNDYIAAKKGGSK